jgi:hypothetical protein
MSCVLTLKIDAKNALKLYEFLKSMPELKQLRNPQV